MDQVVTVYAYSIEHLVQNMEATLEHRMGNGTYCVKDVKPIYFEPNSERYIQTVILELNKELK